MKLRTFRYLLSEGFKNVWSHRLMSVASSGVLMACMLMIGIVFSISANIDNYVSEIQKNAVVMAFFRDDVSREDALAAVSYTHLDVYKRQEHPCRLSVWVGSVFRQFKPYYVAGIFLYILLSFILAYDVVGRTYKLAYVSRLFGESQSFKGSYCCHIIKSFCFGIL